MVIVFFSFFSLCWILYIYSISTLYAVQYDNCKSSPMFISAINGWFQVFLVLDLWFVATQTQSSSPVLFLLTALPHCLKSMLSCVWQQDRILPRDATLSCVCIFFTLFAWSIMSRYINCLFCKN